MQDTSYLGEMIFPQVGYYSICVGFGFFGFFSWKKSGILLFLYPLSINLLLVILFISKYMAIHLNIIIKN